MNLKFHSNFKKLQKNADAPKMHRHISQKYILKTRISYTATL